MYCGDNDDMAVTNSTCGRITSVDKKKITVTWATGAVRQYTTIKDITLAYAITAHKSQGSEYDNVLVACYDVNKMMYCMDRRWLYTSITRGKNNVTLVATKNIVDFIQMKLCNLPISNMTFDD